MGQVTIHLDDQTETRLRQVAGASGGSVGDWLAGLIHERLDDAWPPSVAALAGSWPDCPETSESRRDLGQDARRDEL